MSFASPEPIPQSTKNLDQVLERIDACLPKIHERVRRATVCLNGGGAAAASREHQPPTPATKGISLNQIKRTQATFQAMSEESILTENEDDIREDADRKAVERAREILDED